jgi:hypothetical protein
LTLIRDRQGRLIEDPHAANHLSDACLYAWKGCQHRVQKDPAPNDGMDPRERAMREEAARRARKGSSWLT